MFEFRTTIPPFHSEQSASDLAVVVRSPWPGNSRPSPAELRGSEYDSISGALPVKKLIVCAAPRTSSKRLARLLIGAGIGLPLEYFNDNSVLDLTRRWDVQKNQYLQTLYARRSINGVFACNIQYPQMGHWKNPRDIEDLFSQATVIHLTRDDKLAQAASLATSMLTGRWGFEETPEEARYPDWRIARAARKAMKLVAEDDRLWERWFDVREIVPLRVNTEAVNRADLDLVGEIAGHIGVVFDHDSAQRMLRVDSGAYSGDKLLKARVRDIVAALA